MRELAAEPDFKAGDRIEHFAFGRGTIQEVDRTERAYLVRFDQMPTPRRISFRVRLQRAGSR